MREFVLNSNNNNFFFDKKSYPSLYDTNGLFDKKPKNKAHKQLLYPPINTQYYKLHTPLKTYKSPKDGSD